MSSARIASAVLLVSAFLSARGGTALADSDLKALLAALEKADEPAGRLAEVPRLVANGSPGAASALAGLVKRDPDAGVRAAAADGLGRISAPVALELLLDRARAGGSRKVREAVGRALARREGAVPAVLAIVDGTRAPDAERVLLIQALEGFDDDATRRALLRLAHADPPAMRDAAWRALARRRDAPEELRLAMIALLAEARDETSSLQALDAFEPAAHGDMRPMVERLATSLEPSVREAAEHFLARIRAREAAAAKPAPVPAGNDGRYAPPGGKREEPPPEEPLRSRCDLVYVLDVTGSTFATLPLLRKRILDEVNLMRRVGTSLRVGVVAYRDGPRGPDSAPPMEILSPTFDAARFEAFVNALKPRGVDESGAAVAAGLREALDRTPWRWDATRAVQLFADTGCDDPKAASATVGFHYRADATRTLVAYVLRTRTVVPPEFHELARLGGTGVPELIK